jgi:hypothetical protein
MSEWYRRTRQLENGFSIVAEYDNRAGCYRVCVYNRSGTLLWYANDPWGDKLAALVAEAESRAEQESARSAGISRLLESVLP